MSGAEKNRRRQRRMIQKGRRTRKRQERRKGNWKAGWGRASSEVSLVCVEEAVNPEYVEAV
jgi:hypothetical protein